MHVSTRIKTQPNEYEASRMDTSKRLKTEIDAIVENDFSVLSQNPNCSQHSLMARHQNPLILDYIRNIYDEYHFSDPLKGQLSNNRKSKCEYQ